MLIQYIKFAMYISYTYIYVIPILKGAGLELI